MLYIYVAYLPYVVTSLDAESVLLIRPRLIINEFIIIYLCLKNIIIPYVIVMSCYLTLFYCCRLCKCHHCDDAEQQQHCRQWRGVV